jgi:hypothetical protein
MTLSLYRFLLFGLLAGGSHWLWAAESAEKALYEKKAKVVYNLSRFTYWPESAFQHDSFAICILGETPAGLRQALAHMSDDKLIHGRRVNLRVLGELSEISASAPCHVAFLGHNLAQKQADILAMLHRHAILSIGESADFARQGGIIELLQTDARVRFSLNLDVAQAAGLSFNTQLLMMTHTLPKSRTPAP